MAVQARTVIACARCDAEGRLIEAQEPLAGLQRRCGGEIPGFIAIPELRRLVHKARTYGLRLSRSIRAFDGENMIRAWVEILPAQEAEDAGCEILLSSWQAARAPEESRFASDRREVEIVRATAEFTALLDPRQRVLTAANNAPDLRCFAGRMTEAVGEFWFDLVTLPGLEFEQPLNWRVLDGALCEIDGVARSFSVRIFPLNGDGEPAGYELYLLSDQIVPEEPSSPFIDAEAAEPMAIGMSLAPVLREPVERILASARTIRSRLAGPLAPEYSEYASDVGAAGDHLLTLLDDLSDLALVENDGFEIECGPIDLALATAKAVAMLASQAEARSITLEIGGNTEQCRAAGDYRRTIQILLNVIGNAIRYAPVDSRVLVDLRCDQDTASVSVTDNGEGLDRDQQHAAFNKFERLGRTGDGGSGLGLYISRRLARAMGGDVTVQSVPGEGARFTLTLPPPR